MEEIEVKYLNINSSSIERKLREIGAKKESDEIYEEWLFKKPEWLNVKGRIRVRKAGNYNTMAYKETTKKTSEGNLEIEFAISDETAALAFLEKLQIPQVRHQQKRRIHYTLGTVSIDIDFWPLIPPLVEIEGPTLSDIHRVAKKLSLGKETAIDALQIHENIYGISLSKIKNMVFTKEQLASFARYMRV